jgi:hypothetical protein
MLLNILRKGGNMTIPELEKLRNEQCTCGNKFLFYRLHDVECGFYKGRVEENEVMERSVSTLTEIAGGGRLAEIRTKQQDRMSRYVKGRPGTAPPEYIMMLFEIDYLVKRLDAAEHAAKDFARRAGYKVKE